MTAKPAVLIVEARFYEDIADQLAEGAIAVLNAEGVAYARWAVPGAFEIPAAIGFALDVQRDHPQRQMFEGFVALGCVIRGETDHYEHICRETCRALMDLAVQRNLALGFGVLTCGNYAQAKVRADIHGHNKGADAALACLRMIQMRRNLLSQAP